MTSRSNWEFYIVFQGNCRVTMPGKTTMKLAERSIFISRPGHIHGWRSSREEWEVGVFHFSTVPHSFLDWFSDASYRIHTLEDPDLKSIKGRIKEVELHYSHPNQSSPLYFQRLLCELCIAIMKHEPATHQVSLQNLNRYRVQEAMDWYEKHLQENPKVECVASALHMSSGHLRRLFKAVHDKTPKQVFDGIRARHAKEYMVESSDTLDIIARKSGFQDASELCRVFRRLENGYTPGKWRKHILGPDNDLDELRRKVGSGFLQ
jgi:AraC-like DNA-binding protein